VPTNSTRPVTLAACLVFAMSLLVSLFASTASVAAADAGSSARFIVVLKSTVGDSQAVAADHARRYGVRVSQIYGSALKGYAAAIPTARLSAVAADTQVLMMSPDTEMHAQSQTLGTGVSRIRAAGKPNKGAGVNVAVIDSGIDVTHPDLAANIAGGMNCSRGGKQSYGDENGHGTHVAGIIAALDNDIGVVGVAPAAKLWAVRVLDKNGAGPMSDVVCGVDFVDSLSPAKGGPITVANMSLGGLGADDGQCGTINADALHVAVCKAVGDGVTIVAAAANSGLDLSQATTFVPAAYNEVITVSALADANGAPCGGGSSTTYGADDDFAYFSNFATSPADLGHLMAAPGVNIYSTWKGGGYETKSGTSMASPHVAGAVALYVAAHPGASPSSVRAALMATAEPPNINLNGECGATGNTKRGASPAVSHTDSSARHPEAAVRADSL
jgi:subtilisin